MARKADTNPIGAIEAEIDALQARRLKLEERREKVASRFDHDRSVRKAALADDPDANLSKLTAAVRDAEDEVETLDGVLRDLVEQIADAEQRFGDARDKDKRADAAGALEVIAGSVDDATAKLEAALATTFAAFYDLMAQIPSTFSVVKIGGGETDSFTIAKAILAEGLAAQCPGLFLTRLEFGVVTSDLSRISHPEAKEPSNRFSDIAHSHQVLTAGTTARGLVSDRLRTRAAAIRSGNGSPDFSADVMQRTPPKPTPVPTTTRIMATEDFAFRLVEDGEKTVGHRAETQNLPIAIAEKIIAAGAAVRADSQEAEAIRAEEAERTRPNVTSIADAATGAMVLPSPRAPGSIQYRDLGILGAATVPVFRSVNVGRSAA